MVTYTSETTGDINTLTNRDSFARMIIQPDYTSVTFQVDCGAKVNTIPEKYIQEKSLITLQTWNKSTMQALGNCRLKLQNPSNGNKYSLKFVVNDNFTPLLGSKASQAMNLITINEENFNRVDSVSSVKAKQTNAKPEQQFAEVFSGELQSSTKLVGTPPLPFFNVGYRIFCLRHTFTVFAQHWKGEQCLMLSSELKFTNIMTDCPNSFVQDCRLLPR